MCTVPCLKELKGVTLYETLAGTPSGQEIIGKNGRIVNSWLAPVDGRQTYDFQLNACAAA